MLGRVITHRSVVLRSYPSRYWLMRVAHKVGVEAIRVRRVDEAREVLVRAREGGVALGLHVRLGALGHVKVEMVVVLQVVAVGALGAAVPGATSWATMAVESGEPPSSEAAERRRVLRCVRAELGEIIGADID